MKYFLFVDFFCPVWFFKFAKNNNIIKKRHQTSNLCAARVTLPNVTSASQKVTQR